MQLSPVEKKALCDKVIEKVSDLNIGTIEIDVHSPSKRVDIIKVTERERVIGKNVGDLTNKR